MKHYLAIFVVLSLIACTPPDLLQLPADQPTRDALLLQLDLAVNEFNSIKGLAKSTYTQNGKRKSVNQVIFAEYPDKLRFEALGLFGAPALMAATDGINTVVLLPGEGRAYVGPSGSGFLQKLLRLPLTTSDIVAIILLRLKIIERQSSKVSYLANGISRLTLTAGSNYQEVDFNQSRQIVRVAWFSEGNLHTSVLYDDYEAGFPGRLEVHIPDRQLVASLDFSDVELNAVLKEGLFRLVPPVEYLVEPIPW